MALNGVIAALKQKKAKKGKRMNELCSRHSLKPKGPTRILLL